MTLSFIPALLDFAQNAETAVEKYVGNKEVEAHLIAALNFISDGITTVETKIDSVIDTVADGAKTITDDALTAVTTEIKVIEDQISANQTTPTTPTA